MIKNFFNVAGADAVKRIAEWIRHKFYTKTEIDDMLSAGMRYEVVNELPATGEAGTVYLVPKQSAGTGDVYDEYIYVDGSFEHIGSTEIDLSNYYTKTEADNLLDDKVDKESGKGLSTNDFTTAEKTKLGGIEAGAEVNVQSDWNQGDSTKDDYIKNKPTLHQPSSDGTAGQYLKSNGNGNAPSWETMDSAPTANSTKAVTSGGVKTALDGKQASVTITTNANTPTDNDTVIMQDSGNTGTTSFLRRKLSTLWTYIKGKADVRYLARFDFVNMPNNGFLNELRYFSSQLNDRLWAADQRFNVTWRGYSSSTDEEIYDKDTTAYRLFRGDFELFGSHPVTGEYDIIRIKSKTEGSSMWTYNTGKLILSFYNVSVPPTPPVVRIYGGSTAQWTTLDAPSNPIASVYVYTMPTNTYSLYLKEIEIKVQGKVPGSDPNSAGACLSSVVFIGTRSSAEQESLVTKHAVGQQLYGELTAKKLITRGGTSSQYLRGDGSLTTPSTSPTNGSAALITSGGVYTALQDKQSNLIINIPDNSGYQVMQLIADVTTSLTTPNYNIAGLVGYLYQWRYGGTGRISHRITAIGGHDSGNIFLFTDNNASNGAILPYLIKYNDKYYIALKKGSSARSGIRLLGYWTNLLSEPINLYANSTASKWYSDSARTQEITFEITKSYERYPNAYLNFGGTASQVVLGTGELKTIDSSVASGSSNLVTSGAVATAINGIDTSGKVNLQPDFTASQIDYSAGNVGKWQKVLRFPEGADLVINMKKTAMGSDSTSTLWFSSSSMGDSYTSLFGNHSVRFVHDGGYVFLVLACRKSTYEPIESYTFQIAHSSVPMSDIVAVTDASPITATPKEPSIVYRAPITTGAVSFNVNSSGAGSVSMSGHNDFLGNMTSEATNGVVVTMSGATEGQIYRFVFTRNITGGVTFKQSNVAYCTIQGDVNAGDTITLTAVSNTADGWLYEQESAGIESSDGSNIVEYNGSTADVRVNWDKLPKNIVRNNAYSDANGHRDLAIGQSATADKNALAVGAQAHASDTSVAHGYNAKASNNFAVAVGVNANAEEQGCVAVGYAKALGSYSFAGGMRALAYGFGSIALGYYAESNNNYSIAYGNKAFVCMRSVDANDNVKYRRFRAMNLQSFTVNGEERKFYKPATAGDVTITFSGGGTATVNVTNGTLFVVSDSYAPDITSIFNGIMVDGRYYDAMDGTISLSMFTVTPIAGFNAWAIDIKMPLAYIDTSEVNNAQLLTEILSAYSAEGCAFGNSAKSYGGYALGRGAVTTFPRQTVVGQYNVPSDSDYFQVGYGNGETQLRNILTIDSNERLKVCSYVGETQTIEMSQQTGSLGNITKSVYRIRWNDTGTINLSLDTGGCVEGQRVTIFAETNDVKLFAQPYLIRQGRFCDFMFLGGAWRPSMGIEELVS